MLMSTQANRYAHQLLDARAKAQLIPSLSSRQPLSIDDGYEISKRIYDIRTAEGEQAIGRKIGFSNRAHRAKYGDTGPISEPIWTPMFDSTVQFADNNRGIQSLTGAMQPRIGPEIVFKLGRTPAADASVDALADCIAWMAHGIEIVVCPFPDWKFDTADAIAAFGLHGALIIGEPKRLSAASHHNLAAMLDDTSMSLSCAGTLLAAGFGDEPNSPLLALFYLHQLLQTQPQFAPLTAGEIITTGTWTDAYPIEKGQTWTTALSGVSLPGLTVSFV
jgi:2-keto-4-pentenoate hydratase